MFFFWDDVYIWWNIQIFIVPFDACRQMHLWEPSPHQGTGYYCHSRKFPVALPSLFLTPASQAIIVLNVLLPWISFARSRTSYEWNKTHRVPLMGFCHTSWCSWDSPLLCHLSAVHSFVWVYPGQLFFSLSLSFFKASFNFLLNIIICLARALYPFYFTYLFIYFWGFYFVYYIFIFY